MSPTPRKLATEYGKGTWVCDVTFGVSHGDQARLKLALNCLARHMQWDLCEEQTEAEVGPELLLVDHGRCYQHFANRGTDVPALNRVVPLGHEGWATVINSTGSLSTKPMDWVRHLNRL